MHHRGRLQQHFGDLTKTHGRGGQYTYHRCHQSTNCHPLEYAAIANRADIEVLAQRYLGRAECLRERHIEVLIRSYSSSLFKSLLEVMFTDLVLKTPTNLDQTKDEV